MASQKTNDLLLEQMFQTHADNQLLRGQNKHILKIGNIRVEVLPTSDDKIADVFKQFTKFAKEMKKLHNNSHLKDDGSDSGMSTLMDQMVG
jgi:hypothetical protein|tara:strand:+ start:13424 stop:13696 length:273 start_codon:yes stop_codon:yes gene_type:complete